jgi:hypothetical protein
MKGRQITLTERLAAYFRHTPETWIDGLELARIAGSYAWRSRTSDLRRAPFSMDIQNRVRTVEIEPGRWVKVSEYRYVPSAKTEAA